MTKADVVIDIFSHQVTGLVPENSSSGRALKEKSSKKCEIWANAHSTRKWFCCSFLILIRLGLGLMSQLWSRDISPACGPQCGVTGVSVIKSTKDHKTDPGKNRINIELFSIYGNDYPNICQDCSTECYVDDTKLLLSFNANDPTQAIERLNSDLQRIRNWCFDNCLMHDSNY